MRNFYDEDLKKYNFAVNLITVRRIQESVEGKEFRYKMEGTEKYVWKYEC